ncbi:type III restriction protein res subunit [Ectothiorhodospira sp. PHS-1]|nr:type III restriction protein res subunit [Ectothiorhodospira sp. PHS-1]EHQ53452.1 type III restriction protein res subunit [Ectothiorhodospira sp. PHS-1]
MKCSDCRHRQLLPVTDQVIYDHLAGRQTIGVYPLLTNDRCFLLAADLDGADWREDARAFMHTCRDLDLPAALEISRSGNGAHIWIFFAEPIPAREARQLGAALISHTCDRTRQLSLASYDRLFPNQDTMPVSWKGTLQQYAGRLHREHVEKRDVRIHDYAEIDQPQLARMWARRQRGYRAMGYELKTTLMPAVYPSTPSDNHASLSTLNA